MVYWTTMMKLLNWCVEPKFKGEDVLLPRIPMIPTDMPFEFKRLQFPLRLAFAMTINKAQGQTLQVCGINLKNPCFSHGQLYVACSRVGKPSNLFVFPENEKKQKILSIQKTCNSKNLTFCSFFMNIVLKHKQAFF